MKLSSAGHTPIPLPERKVLVIGRGKHGIAFHATLVSRKHVHVEAYSDYARVKAVGLNPIVIIKKGQRGDGFALAQGEEEMFELGDRFVLKLVGESKRAFELVSSRIDRKRRRSRSPSTQGSPQRSVSPSNRRSRSSSPSTPARSRADPPASRSPLSPPARGRVPSPLSRSPLSPPARVPSSPIRHTPLSPPAPRSPLSLPASPLLFPESPTSPPRRLDSPRSPLSPAAACRSGDETSDGQQGEWGQARQAKPFQGICRYGAKCYRKSGDHRRDWWHPDNGTGTESKPGQAQKPRDQPKPNITTSAKQRKPDTPPSNSGLSSPKHAPSPSSPGSAPKANFGQRCVTHASKERNYRVAFPSISTKEFMFDESRAADVALKVVLEFLRKHRDPRLRLLFVQTHSNYDEEVAAAFRKAKAKESRLEVFSGDITKLASAGLPSRYIVNTTNWRFKAKAGLLNARVNKAVGHGLALLSVERHKTAKLGCAYPIPISSDSGLKLEGVDYVIQVLGPNMNPKRPDCITDITVAEPLLRQCYQEVLAAFFRLTGLPAPLGDSQDYYQEDSDEAHNASPSTLASSSSAGGGGHYSMQQPPKYMPPPPDKQAFTFKGNFRLALLDYLLPSPPSKLQSSIYWQDEQCVVIYDKFPKARVHLLIIPKQRVDEVTALTREHVPLLRSLLHRAQWIAQRLETPQAPIRAGVHAVPSLKQLHVHLISQDFDSPWMKHKKHWNTFTSAFFLPLASVLQEVDSNGSMHVDKPANAALVKQSLQCHRCHLGIRQFPQLKEHIQKCKTPYATHTDLQTCTEQD